MHANHLLSPSLFARRMRVARKLLGISQAELGVRAGIDASSASARINQYERGKHAPDFLTVCNLARVLCVPTAYFYAEEEDLADLIAIFGRLGFPERQAILNLVKSFVGGGGLAGELMAPDAEPSVSDPE